MGIVQVLDVLVLDNQATQITYSRASKIQILFLLYGYNFLRKIGRSDNLKEFLEVDLSKDVLFIAGIRRVTKSKKLIYKVHGLSHLLFATSVARILSHYLR
jgi:hypothetical protein